MGTDRKRPLAAFLVVAVIAVVLLVTSVRSQAASGWLNRRLPASVVAVVPGSGESGLWHAVGDGVNQVVRRGAVLVHKTAPDASSGETTVADAPPSLRAGRTPSTPPAHSSVTHPTRHHASDHALRDQPIAGPGSGGPGGQPSHEAADDQGTQPVDPADDHHGSGHGHENNSSAHHGRDHGRDNGDQCDSVDQGEHGDHGSDGDHGDQGDHGSDGDQTDQTDQTDQGDGSDHGVESDQGQDGSRWSGDRGHGHGHAHHHGHAHGHAHGHGQHGDWSC